MLLLPPLFPETSSARESIRHANHPAYAETLHNLVYRGWQPRDQVLRNVKTLGITMIIDLRGEKQGLLESEIKKPESSGIRVVNIRASGWPSPKDADLLMFLSLAQQPPQETIFVNGWLGDDRSAVCFAGYGIVFDHWTAKQAWMKRIISTSRPFGIRS